MKASAENYLEVILSLLNDGQTVRAVDIATQLGFSRASVSVAMKKLREEGLILVSENGSIDLTKQGRDMAGRVLERHNFLCDWLTSLGVPAEIAAADACQLEHILSEESFRAIMKSHRKN